MQYFKNTRINAKESMIEKKKVKHCLKWKTFNPALIYSLTLWPQYKPDFAEIFSRRASEDSERYS